MRFLGSQVPAALAIPLLLGACQQGVRSAAPSSQQVADAFVSRHPEINGLWEPAVAEQGAGLNYYRRINVEPSCLACHGTKASRPAFIKANYPDDKAFDLTVGELRGMYAVHLPEAQAAPAAAAG